MTAAAVVAVRLSVKRGRHVHRQYGMPYRTAAEPGTFRRRPTSNILWVLCYLLESQRCIWHSRFSRGDLLKLQTPLRGLWLLGVLPGKSGRGLVEDGPSAAW